MADEERKPIYDAYVAYSKSWISIWVVPFLCTDDETLARHYLPYLLEGDPEEPTELNIQEYLPESTPENPVVQQRVIFREAAPEGMGTPPEAWIRLLIVNAKNGHRASTLALELAHKAYLETNREVPRSLSSWSARRLKKPPAPGPGRPTVTERDRRIGWLLQLLFVPRRMAKEAGLSSKRLPIKRKVECERDLCICDARGGRLEQRPRSAPPTHTMALYRRGSTPAGSIALAPTCSRKRGSIRIDLLRSAVAMSARSVRDLMRREPPGNKEP